MAKFRGNLKEGVQAGTGRVKPPAGEHMLRGGEVEVRDDAMRSKAENASTPKGGTSRVGSLPGKVFTGRGGARKRGHRFTAQEAAAILGKR